jgi:hypothetical protein
LAQVADAQQAGAVFLTDVPGVQQCSNTILRHLEAQDFKQFQQGEIQFATTKFVLQ